MKSSSIVSNTQNNTRPAENRWPSAAITDGLANHVCERVFIIVPRNAMLGKMLFGLVGPETQLDRH
jgi:hypothetical protein